MTEREKLLAVEGFFVCQQRENSQEVSCQINEKAGESCWSMRCNPEFKVRGLSVGQAKQVALV